MTERVCYGQTQRRYHFGSKSTWPTAPLDQVVPKTADTLVGGKDAALIVDDTALPKRGENSVGVKRQGCGVLGKQTNCQVLVSLTLAHKEVPIALQLYLPEDWAQDEARRAAAKVTWTCEQAYQQIKDELGKDRAYGHERNRAMPRLPRCRPTMPET